MGFITSLLGIDEQINSLKFRTDRLEKLALKGIETKYKTGDSVSYWAKDKLDLFNTCTSVTAKNGLITDIDKRFSCCGKGGVTVYYSIFDGGNTITVTESRIIELTQQQTEK